MTKYRIIGNMTGNSMDAIDLVLTDFDGDRMTDVCSYTEPYSDDMRQKVARLRDMVTKEKMSMAAFEKSPEFSAFHDEYISGIAKAVQNMCRQNNIDPANIDAIGFHGKTLDHFPPSVAVKENGKPYTLQVGSGQMLANLTGIPVIYDFRSAPIMNNYEGAPLAPPHNAHVAITEGDGIYYNAGNTSNLSLIVDHNAVAGWDAGPFNDFTDNLIRRHTGNQKAYDKDGMYALKGTLMPALLKDLFDNSAITDAGENFYNLPAPKSGDPAFYHFDRISAFLNPGAHLNDVVHTSAYFSAYVAVHSLKYLPDKTVVPHRFILFGGGWHHPVAMQTFKDLLQGKGFILPEHQADFARIRNRFQNADIRYSTFGTYMEARLFADLARYHLEGKTWEIPELVRDKKELVLGVMRRPHQGPVNDRINLAAKGWQSKEMVNVFSQKTYI